MVEKTTVFNFLDGLTVEQCGKFAKHGYHFEIANGHVQTMVKDGEEGSENVGAKV